MIKKNKTCRACLSKKLTQILSYKKSPIGDEYITEDRLNIIQPLFPIDTYQCIDCGFTQLLDVIDPEVLYGNYIYNTKSSPGLKKHFQDFVTNLLNKYSISDKSLVIDIGSNDGVLLQEFKNKNMITLGIEPSKEIAKKSNENGIKTYDEFLSLELTNKIIQEYGAADVITSNNVFANIDDIHNWIICVKNLMSTNAIYVFESFYLADVIENSVFDFIYHEHLSAFSVKPIKKLFEHFGLKLVDIEPIDTKGGSLRYYAQNQSGNLNISKNIEYYLEYENKKKLYDKETYDSFTIKINELKNKTLTYLRKAKNDGMKIAGFGASITCTTLIYHFEIEKIIDYLVDDNEAKQGTFSPGSHIPVFSVEQLLIEKPDIIIILAWRFSDIIFETHKKILNNFDKIIIPVPEFKIIKNN